MHEVGAHIVVLVRAPLNGPHPVLGSTPVGDTKGTVVQGYVVKIATGRASISGVPVGLIIDYFALEQTDADVGEIANLIGTRGEIGGKGFSGCVREGGPGARCHVQSPQSVRVG